MDAVIETPKSPKTVAVYNVGSMEFPFDATVANTGLARAYESVADAEFEHVQGGDTVRSYTFGAEVDAVAVYLKTAERNMKAKIELTQGTRSARSKRERERERERERKRERERHARTHTTQARTHPHGVPAMRYLMSVPMPICCAQEPAIEFVKQQQDAAAAAAGSPAATELTAADAQALIFGGEPQGVDLR